MIDDTPLLRQSCRAEFHVEKAAVDDLEKFIKREVTDLHPTWKVSFIANHELKDPVMRASDTYGVITRLVGILHRNELLQFLHKILMKFRIVWMHTDAYREFKKFPDLENSVSIEVKMDSIHFYKFGKYMTVETLPGYIYTAIQSNLVNMPEGQYMAHTISESMWEQVYRSKEAFRYRIFVRDWSNRYTNGNDGSFYDSKDFENEVHEMVIRMTVTPEAEELLKTWLISKDVLLKVDDKPQYEIMSHNEEEVTVSFITVEMPDASQRYGFLDELVHAVSQMDLRRLEGNGYMKTVQYDPQNDEEIEHLYDVEKYDYVNGELRWLGRFLCVDRLPVGLYQKVIEDDFDDESEDNRDVEGAILGDVAHHSVVSDEIYIYAP